MFPASPPEPIVQLEALYEAIRDYLKRSVSPELPHESSARIKLAELLFICYTRLDRYDASRNLFKLAVGDMAFADTALKQAFESVYDFYSDHGRGLIAKRRIEFLEESASALSSAVISVKS